MSKISYRPFINVMGPTKCIVYLSCECFIKCVLFTLRLKAYHVFTKVDSRDLQMSNMLIWRYHCLGEVAFLNIWNQYWLPSDTVHQRFFVHLPCPFSNLDYRSLESTLINNYSFALTVHWWVCKFTLLRVWTRCTPLEGSDDLN